MAVMDTVNPILVEVTRGDMVESIHRGAVAVCTARGEVAAAWGDTDRVVYPRSAIKPLQALPLLETGAAEHLLVSDTELALACASHNGEPVHARSVEEWLRRLELAGDDLECGPQPPKPDEEKAAMALAGENPGRIHNNCSGKHTGMLATALHLGEPTAGYTQASHPVQRRLRGMLSEMGQCDLTDAPAGIDGCGIPVLGMPLASVARAMAKLGAPDGLVPARQQAARRIVAAMTAHPYLVGGKERFDTVVMEAAKGAIAVKVGAEGVHTAILPGLGFGVAVKIDDGATRASEVAMVSVLKHLGVLDAAATKALAEVFRVPLTNWNEDLVGEIRPADGWPG